MQLMGALVTLIVLLKSPNVIAQNYKNTLDCVFVNTSTHEFAEEWKAETISSSDFKVTFSELKSKHPLLVGNAGSAKLDKVETGSEIYLLEQTPLGSLNVWTFFPSKMVMLLSKQYLLIAIPYGTMMSGKCKYR